MKISEKYLHDHPCTSVIRDGVNCIFQSHNTYILERFSTPFKKHVTLNNFRKRYVRFQVEAFAMLGFSNTSIQMHEGPRSLFDVLQKKHALQICFWYLCGKI